MHLLHPLLNINSDYSPGWTFCGRPLCFLLGRNWTFKYYLDAFKSAGEGGGILQIETETASTQGTTLLSVDAMYSELQTTLVYLCVYECTQACVCLYKYVCISSECSCLYMRAHAYLCVYVCMSARV